MPNVGTGIGGGRPGTAKIGGICVRFAPGRLNSPELEYQQHLHPLPNEAMRTGLFRLHSRVLFVTRSVDVPAAGLALALRDRDCAHRCG